MYNYIYIYVTTIAYTVYISTHERKSDEAIDKTCLFGSRAFEQGPGTIGCLGAGNAAQCGGWQCGGLEWIKI